MFTIVDTLVGLPIDERTQFPGLFYCDISILLTVYVLLLVLRISLGKLINKSCDRQHPNPLLLIFNGFMFGGYGIFFLVGLHCMDYGLLFFDCSKLPDPASIDVKSNLSVFTLMALHYGMFIRFLEPLLYQIAGQPCPYSKANQVEEFILHGLGIIAARFYCYNYFGLAPLLHALTSLVFYAKQTLVSTGCETMVPSQSWNKLIMRLTILEKIIPTLHGLWGIRQESCYYLRPLIQLEIYAPFLVIPFTLTSKTIENHLSDLKRS